MVQLIKIERLGPRIEGMLYRRKFDETWTLLDDVCLFRLVISCGSDFGTERKKDDGGW